METAFIKIVQQVVSERGKNVVTNTAVFNSLLADYACGQFVRERRLFMRELKTKSLSEVMNQYLPQSPEPAKPSASSTYTTQPAAHSESYSEDNNYAEDKDDDIEDMDTDDYDDDDNENENKTGDKKSPGSIRQASGFTIKCPKCGAEYPITDKRVLRCFDQGFICDFCGASWKVSFFGTCANCKEKVGFDNWSWGNNLAYLGTSFLAALNKKDNIFTAIGDIANSVIPESGAFGVCPICKQEHAACPRCGGASAFSSLKQARGKTIKCGHCGQKMKL
jgi:hypothetical protein